MGDSPRQVLLHRQEQPQASIPWICPVQLQQSSGVREAFGSNKNRVFGGVVWAQYQSTSSKGCWLPDAVDILNIVVVKSFFKERLSSICALLRESFKCNVSVLNMSNDFFEKESASVMTSENPNSYPVAVSAATRCQFAAICQHYDLFSGCIISLLVSIQQLYNAAAAAQIILILVRVVIHSCLSIFHLFCRTFPYNPSTDLGGHSMNFVKVFNILDRDFSSYQR
jgi:hypothetical protein